jgi:hypothetical protein
MKTTVNISVEIFNGARLRCTSFHSMDTCATITWGELIKAAAAATTVADVGLQISPNSVLLEYVPDKASAKGVVKLHLADVIGDAFMRKAGFSVQLQVGIRKKMLLRMMEAHDDKRIPVDKIAAMMYHSLCLTDGLVIMAANVKATLGYEVAEFYLQFESAKLMSTIKHYFENFFKVVSARAGAAKDLAGMKRKSCIIIDSVPDSPCILATSPSALLQQLYDAKEPYRGRTKLHAP